MVGRRDVKPYREVRPVSKDTFKAYFDKTVVDMGPKDPWTLTVKSFWDQVEDADKIEYVRVGDSGFSATFYLLTKPDGRVIKLSESAGMY